MASLAMGNNQLQPGSYKPLSVNPSISDFKFDGLQGGLAFGLNKPSGAYTNNANVNTGSMDGVDGSNISFGNLVPAGTDIKTGLAGLGEKLGGWGNVGGNIMDAASMYMNYRAMQDGNKINNRKMDMLEEQQGLAKRAADTNYANQQSMARQMV